MDYKFENDSEKEETNSLNAIFILKDGNYYLTSGKICSKRNKPVRLLELLRNPDLAEVYNTGLFLTNPSLYNSNQIIIKNPSFERYVDISKIVIAYEKQENNITDAEIKEIDNHSFCEKEDVSLLTKDDHSSEFSIKGKSSDIKPKLNDDLNYNEVIFSYVTNPTITVNGNRMEDYLIKITKSWDMIINLKYFKLL